MPRLVHHTAVLALFIAASLRAADPPAVEFARDVRPILAKHCFACHGPDKQKGGLRLDRRADAMKGGDDGAAILPKKGADSPLVRLTSGAEPDRVMPPKGEKLTAAQVATLKAWIDQGAEWPGGTDDADPLDWWAFRPLNKPPVPTFTGADAKWVRTPVDAFVLAKLKEKGLAPSPEADRRTLARRLSFDLTGLPPTPEEIETFEKDSAAESSPPLGKGGSGKSGPAERRLREAGG